VSSLEFINIYMLFMYLFYFKNVGKILKNASKRDKNEKRKNVLCLWFLLR